jgi:hypothetical protein
MGSRKKKPTMKHCDRLWSKIIRAMHPICVICGGTPVQGAHLFSRRYKSTRHAIWNGRGLCAGCHVRLTHDPIAHDDWCREILGKAYWRRRRQAQKLAGTTDYAARFEQLEEIQDEIEKGQWSRISHRLKQA